MRTAIFLLLSLAGLQAAEVARWGPARSNGLSLEKGTWRIEAAALLTYKAAWKKDRTKERTTSDAAMAKMQATETAQQVVDAAVQLLGGLGVTRGHPVERLYREVRALRIYEGATEVQKVIIARQLLK